MQQVAKQLGLAVRNGAKAKQFFQPVSECEFTLISLLDDLSREGWPVGAERRPPRCTGAALSVAIGLLELTFAQQSARVMLVGVEFAETIRSHFDMQK